MRRNSSVAAVDCRQLRLGNDHENLGIAWILHMKAQS
jgi:hypothetical protein